MNATFTQVLITDIYPTNVSSALLNTVQDLKIANFFVYNQTSPFKETVWLNPVAPNSNFSENFSFSQVSLHQNWGNANSDAAYGDSKGAHFQWIGNTNKTKITFNFPSKFSINSSSNLASNLYGNYTFNYAHVVFSYGFANGTTINSSGFSLTSSPFTLSEALAQNHLPSGYNVSKVTTISATVQVYYKSKTTTNKPFINIYNYPAKEGNNITISTTTSGITLIPQGNQNNPDQKVAEYQYLVNYNQNSPSTYTLYLKLNPNSNIPNYKDYSFELAIYDNTTKSFIANNYQTYNQSKLLTSSFTLNTKDNYSIYAVYFIPVNITTNMFGSLFKFNTINWTTVPYDLTNSTSNLQNPYQLGVNNYTETFFMLPPDDPTIYDYQQNGAPILESGFWNGAQFTNTNATLGDYGDPLGCLLYGDISSCLGFSQFTLNGQAFRQKSAPLTLAFANGENLYKEVLFNSSGNAFGVVIDNYSFHGVYYYPLIISSPGVYPGDFYPTAFYYSNVNLNNQFNSLSSPIMNINAYYGYYIPVYQTSGVCPLFGNCNTNPTPILNMINNAKAGNYAYQYIENFLYFANSTSAISFSFPSSIPIFIIHNETQPGTPPIISSSWYNYTTTGYGRTLIQTNQSVGYCPSYTGITLTPQIPSSGSQANMFAFYLTH